MRRCLSSSELMTSGSSQSSCLSLLGCIIQTFPYTSMILQPEAPRSKYCGCSKGGSEKEGENRYLPGYMSEVLDKIHASYMCWLCSFARETHQLDTGAMRWRLRASSGNQVLCMKRLAYGWERTRAILWSTPAIGLMAWRMSMSQAAACFLRLVSSHGVVREH